MKGALTPQVESKNTYVTIVAKIQEVRFNKPVVRFTKLVWQIVPLTEFTLRFF